MERRDFFKTSLTAAAAVSALSVPTLLTGCTPKPEVKANDTKLHLSFQSGTTGKETYAEKFDMMEELGIEGFEPGGMELVENANEIAQALKGRNIKVSALCAGFDGFILSKDAAIKASFDSTMREIIDAGGQFGSTGVIMVPAFNGQAETAMPHTQETRDYLCEELRGLGEYALSKGTTVILEPLNRDEAFYLRLVSDAAAICRDVNCEGVKCMGDFWHMKEETSDYAAFIAAGKYLQHVHMASRGHRRMPGEDGELDNYVDGFRALKEMGYDKYVSFECGCDGDRAVAVPAAVALLREQWAKA